VEAHADDRRAPRYVNRDGQAMPYRLRKPISRIDARFNCCQQSKSLIQRCFGDRYWIRSAKRCSVRLCRPDRSDSRTLADISVLIRTSMSALGYVTIRYWRVATAARLEKSSPEVGKCEGKGSKYPQGYPSNGSVFRVRIELASGNRLLSRRSIPSEGLSHEAPTIKL
jgi:hypothetical protein